VNLDHEYTDPAFPSLPRRAIDLRSNCLIDTPEKCRYVALSYVWAQASTIQLKKGNYALLYRKDSLTPLTSPATFADAMTVASELGEDFLWIDALCIVQDGEEDEKRKEIDAMASIYHNAVIAIVALDGADANTGLPGIRPASRTIEQLYGSVGNATLMTSQPDYSSAIRDSRWNRRAWTFQERLLSQRCVVFSESQVYFACDQAICTEDLEVDLNNPHTTISFPTRSSSSDGIYPNPGLPDDARSSPNMRGQPFRIKGGLRAFLSYRDAVEEYTKRSLIYAADILNAF
jgi:hypothetical protein